MVRMLLDEARAWSSLQHLHCAVVEAANGVAAGAAVGSVEGAADGDAYGNVNGNSHDECADASWQRESAHVAALSALAMQTDQMHAEISKLRALIKAKCRLHAATPLPSALVTSSHERLAMGESLARNGAMQLAAATSKLRVASQAVRTQLSQTRALLDLIAGAQNLGIPTGSELLIAVKFQGELYTDNVQNVLAAIFASGDAVTTEEHLGQTLRSLLQRTDVPEHQPVATGEGSCVGVPVRTFARRAPDR